MKFITDILQSVSGNTKTKVNDPLIGAFIGSWIFCNWNYLAILLYGDGTATERISAFNKYLKETEVFAFNSLFSIPLFISVIFLFVFPWVSLFLKWAQKNANHRLHQQAVSIEVSETKEQEALNRQRLLANPDKKFLEQNVQLDIDRRKEVIEQLKMRTAKRRADAEEAEAKLQTAAAAEQEAKSRASLAQLDEEKKQQNAAIERQRFALESTKLRSAQASNRFPSAYSFMLAIEDHLKSDGIQLSLSGIGDIVAVVFGYDKFEYLILDEKFNNKNLSEVKYIYYDPQELATGFENIVQNEEPGNEVLNSDVLFDNVISVFESMDYTLVSKDQAEELCREFCEDNRHDVLNSDGLSGPMAESDTFYEEVEINDLESIIFNEGLTAIFSGTASGSHRRDDDIPGRDIGFSIEIKGAVLIGTKGLGELEIGEITGSLNDYDDEEDDIGRH